jgi:hypothetical protein
MDRYASALLQPSDHLPLHIALLVQAPRSVLSDDVLSFADKLPNRVETFPPNGPIVTRIWNATPTGQKFAAPTEKAFTKFASLRIILFGGQPCAR